jgi:ABC-type amino acid transport substrate-binding protein
MPISDILQFPNDPTILDGLAANRMRYALMPTAGLHVAMAQRKLDIVTRSPIVGAPSSAAACAFRKQDVDLYSAFQRELHALKAAGEFLKIVSEAGFDASPELLHATAEERCR